MKKFVKYGAYTAIGVIALAMVLVGIIAATFNPNDYKSLIVQLVQDKKQRTLDLEGDIRLTFWPKIGADLGKISLSEHQSPKAFASIERLKVSLALLPLLKKELVVDAVYIDGLNVTAIRRKDGTTNFDDLMSPSEEDEESEQIKFDVDGVHVSNTNIQFIDESQSTAYEIKDFNLDTGHVALAQPFNLKTNFQLKTKKPAVNANIQVAGNFMLDVENKHYVAKKLAAAIDGNLASLSNAHIKLDGNIEAKPEAMELLVDALKFSVKGNQAGANLALALSAPQLKLQKDLVSSQETRLTFNQEKGADTVNASLVIANLKGSAKSIQSSAVSGEVSTKQGDRKILGKFSSPLTGNIEQLIFDLPALAGNVEIADPTLPKGDMKAAFKLNLHTDVKQEVVKTNLAIDLDDIHLKGNIGLASFSQPALQFDLNINKLDADQYITKSEKTANKSDTNADSPIDLSALKSVNANGSLTVGALKLANINLRDVKLRLKANQGLAELAPFSAKLYEGNMNGALRIDARNTPSIAFKQNMTGIAIEPLLKDAINNDMLSGKGSLNVEIKTTGNTVNALKKTLNGSASIQLADGAVKGIDVAGTIRGIKDKLNVMKQSNVTGDKSKKTDFAEMSASFNIKNGVAHNEDLNIKAPILRIAGNGEIDIANQTINYLAKPTIINSLKGQSGADLAMLNGLTIPIKVTGSFDKPSYALDFSGIAASIAKNKLLENVGGSKANLINSLVGGNKKEAASNNEGTQQAPSSATPIEDKAKKKLNKFLGL